MEANIVKVGWGASMRYLHNFMICKTNSPNVEVVGNYRNYNNNNNNNNNNGIHLYIYRIALSVLKNFSP